MPIRNDRVGSANSLYRALQKFQRRLAITALRGEYFAHLTFVIHSSPQIMRLAVDTNEYLVQMPAPEGIRIALNSALPDLRREYRTEPVPPKPHRLMADVNATFEQNVLDLAQRQRIADLHHHRQADHLG